MTRPRLAALAAVLALVIWVVTGVTRIPATGDTFAVRRWIGGQARALEPGWVVAPAGIARVASFPRRVDRLPVRVGVPPQTPLRSPEGAALFAAGRLVLRPDPLRAEALLDAFPRGWRAQEVSGELAAALRAPMERQASTIPFVDSMARTGAAAAPVPAPVAEALAGMGLAVEPEAEMRLYPRTARTGGPASLEAAGPPSGRRVLLIGLDGADWDLIDPLMAAGKMPHLGRLVAGGTRARLKTITPVLSPIIWTSIATGVGPDRHGIVDFFATSKTTGAQIPVTSNMRQVKALWNIMSDRGLSSGVVAWWATWPAEPVEGFIVSDRVAYQLFGYEGHGEQLRRRAFPEQLSLALQPRIVAPESVGDDLVLRFFDPAAPGVTDMADHVRRLKQNLASARTYLDIGLDLLTAYDPDLKAIYFEGTDTIAHNFMRYRPPAMPGVLPAEVAALGEVVDRYYVYQDEMLGRVLDLADDRTVVIVCSDHGFRSGSNRPPTDPRIDMGGAADWHRKFGVLIASGPGIRAGVTMEDASVLDITPTVLAAMGLPAARDMQGRILHEMFAAPPPAEPIATYEGESPGGAGAAEPIASALDEEIRARLTALGYVAQEGTNALNNTGITLLDKGRFAEAAEAFRQALQKEPGFQAARVNLGRAQMMMKEYEQAAGTLEAVLRADPRQTEVYTLLGNILMERGDLRGAERRFREGLAHRPDDTNARNSLGLLYDRMGRDLEAIAEYEKVIAVDADYAEGYNNIGLIHRKRGDPRRAIELFRRAIEADPDFPGSYNNMGLTHQDLGERAEARAAFERGLEVDPRNAVILNNLGTLDLAEQRLEDARARFEQSIEADPEYPSALNNLGAVLGMMGRDQEAFEQYLKAVELDPDYTDARFNLARAFLLQGRRGEAAEMLRRVLAIDPEYFKARLQLGMILAQGGEMAAALEEARLAVRLVPASPDAHNLLADIYAATGRREEARRELERSLELNAEQPRVREMLGRLR
jgi:tetratricopeptide (TPR) repeat protein